MTDRRRYASKHLIVRRTYDNQLYVGYPYRTGSLASLTFDYISYSVESILLLLDIRASGEKLYIMRWLDHKKLVNIFISSYVLCTIRKLLHWHKIGMDILILRS